MATSEEIKLPRARLSFPHVFTPKPFREGQTPRFEGSFLLDPSNEAHKAVIKVIKKTAKALAEEHWGKGKVPKSLGVGFGDGNNKEYDGYQDMFYINSANKHRPTVVGRQKEQLQEADGVVYAGCFVNAIITLWVQDNEYGKRVNANLRAIQFVADGEAFGVKPVDADSAFDDLGEGEAGDEEDFLS